MMRTHRLGEVQTQIGRDVAALRLDVAAGEERSAAALAAATGELRRGFADGRAAQERQEAALEALSRELEATAGRVAAQAEELAAVRKAVELDDAVQSILDNAGGVRGSREPGAGDAVGAAAATAQGRELTSVDGAPAAVPAARAAGAAPQGGAPPGEHLRGLPPCDVRRMAALAGPLLPASVVGHSRVLGDEAAVMRLHSALSALFRARTDPRVHPLARAVTSPAVLPACLPLAVSTMSEGADGADGGGDGAEDVYIELQLQPPARVTAVSFRYPPYGTWDTKSALQGLSVTLHEEEAPLADGGGAAGADSPQHQARAALMARRVSLQPLAGMECQHVRVPAPPAAAETAAAAAAGASGGGAGGDVAAAPSLSLPLVHRVTLHITRNFGNSRYACVPRVLLHGTGSEA
ncbi:hypothetical protein GPECTOR_75g737 [Gonium pectorale]|uniref:SUN domain-containing protein n=1 Tax=Gonium pectorale TaxID=33097 RepID=A0A150G2G6_GONPE|nr:hypothetical protein GPECTOR_75g737 [Gonium pectorale]|eukprot:KXZ44013.1 hypothetical protein GPECTOR_75g737 [Gonium pectorale]